MKIRSASVTEITFTDVDGFNPISLILEDFAPSEGQATILCGAQAWTHRWDAMGDMRVRDFFCSVGIEYLSEVMLPPNTPSHHGHDLHLARIIAVTRAGLEAMLAFEIAANPLPDDTPPTLLQRSSSIEADEI